MWWIFSFDLTTLYLIMSKISLVPLFGTDNPRPHSNCPKTSTEFLTCSPTSSWMIALANHRSLDNPLTSHTIWSHLSTPSLLNVQTRQHFPSCSAYYTNCQLSSPIHLVGLFYHWLQTYIRTPSISKTLRHFFSKFLAYTLTDQ